MQLTSKPPFLFWSAWRAAVVSSGVCRVLPVVVGAPVEGCQQDAQWSLLLHAVVAVHTCDFVKCGVDAAVASLPVHLHWSQQQQARWSLVQLLPCLCLVAAILKSSMPSMWVLYAPRTVDVACRTCVVPAVCDLLSL